MGAFFACLILVMVISYLAALIIIPLFELLCYLISDLFELIGYALLMVPVLLFRALLLGPVLLWAGLRFLWRLKFGPPQAEAGPEYQYQHHQYHHHHDDDRHEEWDPEPSPFRSRYDAACYILGLTPNDFDQSEFKAAYRRAVKLTHPDLGGDVEDAQTVNRSAEIIRAAHGW